MYRMHMTAKGQQIRIDQLEDDHLYNCVVMYAEQIDEQVTIASGKYLPDNEFEAIFFAEAAPEAQRANAKKRIEEITARLKDYVMEASIRNIDVSEPLQLAFRRQKRNKPKFSSKVGKLLKDSKEEHY